MTTEAAGAKRVGFLELFFDLVFVFAITQLVDLLLDDHSLAGWGRAALVLWLIWWAWSQFAWAGNAIDLDRRRTRLALLAVTGAALVAAAAIPTAFDAGAWWFAVPYAAVRLGGLAMYWVGLADEPEHRAALTTYLPVASISPLLILAGAAAHGPARAGLWTAAVVVDVASVLAAGRGEFHVDPAHFAERHGLIVIIALGESVVAVGATASAVGLAPTEVALLAASFATVAGLWWCYFDRVHAAAEEHLAAEPDHRRRGHLARDLYTLGHLPIVAGTVVLAAGVEEVLAHPTDPIEGFALAALALGPATYLAGFVFGTLRTTGQLPISRAAGMVAVVAWIALAGPHVPPLAAITGLATIIGGVAVVESRQPT